MLGQRTVVWAESLHFINELGLNLHVRPWGGYGHSELGPRTK